MELIDELEKRELIYQVTDRDGLAKRLTKGKITLYVGFDPTGDSLHIGNLLQILLLRRFQLHGHKPVGLVGSGTGLIGDPSGKSSERQLNPAEVVDEWSRKIRGQLEKLLDFESKTNPAQVVSNYDWLGELELIPFMRDIGKHFPMGVMLAKDSVKSRLDSGISFTEFSYMTLQAFDYLQLNQKLDCELQAGGSDQWGNITAGVDLIRRVRRETVFGMTLPLITRSDGAKLGKTAGDAIWLDEEKTTPFDFYQYFINTTDEDVIRFLGYFTFLSNGDIAELEREVQSNPSARVAQRTLAEEITMLVHGKESMESARNTSQALFYGQVGHLTEKEIEQGLHNVPTYEMRGDAEVTLVDLLSKAEISFSKRRAREDIKNGAIWVNDKRWRDVDKLLTTGDRLHGKYIIIRRGKSNYHLVRWLV